MDDIIKEITSDGLLEKNDAKKIKKARLEELDSLVDIIGMASHLNTEKKTLYKKLAELYIADFRNNLFKDQFALKDANPGTSVDEWGMFLNDRVIMTYVNRHKRIMMKAGAEENLLDPTGKNKRDNLNLLKSLEEKEKAFSNQNIIIMRLPNKYE